MMCSCTKRRNYTNVICNWLNIILTLVVSGDQVFTKDVVWVWGSSSPGNSFRNTTQMNEHNANVTYAITHEIK